MTKAPRCAAARTTANLALLALLLPFVGACLAETVPEEDPPTWAAILALTVDADGAMALEHQTYATMDEAAPLFLDDLAPTFEVRVVDDTTDRVLADVRVAAPTPFIDEVFPAPGVIEGDLEDVAEQTRLIAAPIPTGGTFRISVRRIGSTAADAIRSFFVDATGDDDAVVMDAAGPTTTDFDLPAPSERAGTRMSRREPEAGDTRSGTSPRAGTGGTTCGNGVIDGRERCDDGNSESGDGCSAVCNHELRHLAGATDPAGTIQVVLVPTTWSALSAAEAFDRRMAEATLALAPFSEYRDRISVWMLQDLSVASRAGMPPIPTGSSALCGDHRVMGSVFNNIISRHLLGASTEGGGSVSPQLLILSHEENCRSYKVQNGVSFGRDSRPGVLGHELGHLLGALPDEYSDAGWCSEAQFGASPNLSNPAPLEWACVEGETTCPGGEGIGHYPVGGGCDARVGTACQACMMRDATTDFCPICQGQLRARLDQMLGETLTEACDGSDNDLDGRADEDCMCAEMCADESSPCSGSGPEFDDECCGDLICVVGVCRQPEGGREQDSCDSTVADSCALGLSCRDSASSMGTGCCARGLQYCTQGADCCGMMACRDNVCQYRQPGQSCYIGDCEGPSFCSAGTCSGG